MLNWKYINDTYIYDGSFDGLLTIIFDCYINKIIPLNIISKINYVENILDITINITTNYTKAERIFNGIASHISYDVLYNAYNAFLCEMNNKEITILKYICHGFLIGSEINNMLNIDYVMQTNLMKKKSLFECHRLKGLLRFIELGNNIYYSKIHPDNNILEPLGQHFIKRLPNQKFIIHDQNRNIIFIYDKKQYKIIDASNLNISNISNDEKKYQELWKMFFNTISIKERKNSRCQMQYMPKKYWKDLIEKPI